MTLIELQALEAYLLGEGVRHWTEFSSVYWTCYQTTKYAGLLAAHAVQIEHHVQSIFSVKWHGQAVFCNSAEKKERLFVPGEWLDALEQIRVLIDYEAEQKTLAADQEELVRLQWLLDRYSALGNPPLDFSTALPLDTAVLVDAFDYYVSGYIAGYNPLTQLYTVHTEENTYFVPRDQIKPIASAPPQSTPDQNGAETEE